MITWVYRLSEPHKNTAALRQVAHVNVGNAQVKNPRPTEICKREARRFQRVGG